MKKSISLKLGMFTLAGTVFMASCSPTFEESIDPQQVNSTEVLSAPDSFSDTNARKSVEKNYFERFTNQLAQVDESGSPTYDIPAYLPGTGIGNSSHMGKASTFINQYASYGEHGLGTVGAPVTQFYSEQLEAMGIIVDNPEVSAVTTDGKGNSIWFKNLQNVITSDTDEKVNFEAEVEIVGGTGKFENATGSGTVKGYFNPNNGQGMSTIQGRLEY